MASPPAADVGKEAGLKVWRVESMTPVLIKTEAHGSFYSGDSYVILSTKESMKESVIGA